MALKDAPEKLQPYLFYGVDLEWDGSKDARGTCPFCGKDDHFFVCQDKGLWNCRVCGEGSLKGGGNIYTFMQAYWDACNSEFDKDQYKKLSKQRNLSIQTLLDWGVVWGFLTNEWLLPCHNKDKSMVNLYRYAQFKKKDGTPIKRFIGCPTLDAGLFGMINYSDKNKRTEFCEGPFDGMVLYEAMKSHCDKGSGKFVPTSKPQRSLLRGRNIVAVPGCETFLDKWAFYFKGHDARFWYDSDHPRKHPKLEKLIEPAGYAGMRRAIQVTVKSLNSAQIIDWGPNGYDPNRPSGFDLSDLKKEESSVALLNLSFTDPPEDWLINPNIPRDSEGHTIEPAVCTSYKELMNHWRKALKMTELIDTTLSVILACAAGTDLKSQSDTVWIRIIGPPGSAKTTLCEALSISHHTFPTSVQRGFHSGYIGKGPGESEDGEATDSSLIPLIKNKTVIIKDGDTLLTSPSRDQTLAELRDIYDGTSRAHFRNKKSNIYKGINTTFILAGTGSLRKLNRAYLGERFLDCIIYDRAEGCSELEDDILNRAAFGALKCMRQSSDGSEEGLVDENLLQAWKHTAGYLNWLREDIDGQKRNLLLIRDIDCPAEILQTCKSFGSYVSYMRAKPDKGLDDEDDNEVELPTRLTRQFVRLANLLALAMNHKSVDTVVMERVAKVVRDTSRGLTHKIVTLLYDNRKTGLSTSNIENHLRKSTQTVLRHLKFLKSIGVVRNRRVSNGSGNRGAKKTIWELTGTIHKLHRELSRYRVISVRTKNEEQKV